MNSTISLRICKRYLLTRPKGCERGADSRPEAMNALGEAGNGTAFEAACKGINADRIRCGILTVEGRAFSAGGNVMKDAGARHGAFAGSPAEIREAYRTNIHGISKVSVRPAIGVTVFGALLATAPGVFAEETQCRGTIGARTLDNIFVPDGQRCVLDRTRAKGSVVVGRGATLTATGVSINGNLQAESARSVWLRNFSFVGSSVQIVQGGAAIIETASIEGSLLFDDNDGSVRATRNSIGDNLQAFQNTGGVAISQNVIDGNLQCKANVPAPTGGGNQASSKEDQCLICSADVPSATCGRRARLGARGCLAITRIEFVTHATTIFSAPRRGVALVFARPRGR
jgi:hypothetical protein